MFIIIKKKERNPIIFENQNEAGEHYAKCNKTDRERKVLSGITYRWTLKKMFNHINSSMVVTRGWGRRQMGKC